MNNNLYFKLKLIIADLQNYYLQAEDEEGTSATQQTAKETENYTEDCFQNGLGLEWIVWKVGSQQNPDFKIFSRETWNQIFQLCKLKSLTPRKEKRFFKDPRNEERMKFILQDQNLKWPSDFKDGGRYRRWLIRFLSVTKKEIDKWAEKRKVIDISVKGTTTDYRVNRNPPRLGDQTIFVNFYNVKGGKQVFVATGDEIIKNVSKISNKTAEEQDAYLELYEKERRNFVEKFRKLGEGMPIVPADAQPNTSAPANLMNINSSIDVIFNLFNNALKNNDENDSNIFVVSSE